MELRLSSLGGYEPIIYQWPYLYKDQGCEIIEAISFACREEPPLRKYSEEILSGCITSSYENMKVVCQRFNQAVDHLRSLVTSGLYEVKRRASVELLHHVIQTCYNRAVVDPDKLNHYEPFSAEVYGETSFELVHQMIETIKFTEHDQFIDLGSGVGHVVLQVAASTPCKSCHGIEKAQWPALYAKQMGAEFEKWMRFYGKECSSYDLLKGNFLSDQFKDVISNATVIFVNNFAFGPQVDHELKLRFSNLKEGTKIVSSKAFCALNMQITERNLSDIGAILTVEELSPLRGPVSWTPKRVTYYLHTINRTQLEEYFKMRQNPHKKQRKSLTSNFFKTAKKREDGDHKQIKSSKEWRRKSGPNIKRPATINMVSTITCANPNTVPRTNKRSSWNDSFISSLSSSHKAYIFPSAQSLTFEESNNLQLAGPTPDSPRKQYILTSKQATPKMNHDGRTPFSTPSTKDMLLGFCSDENDLSEELQLEIENIITLFHNETSKISHQDAYRPSAIFNDPSLVESIFVPEDKKIGQNDLLSIDPKPTLNVSKSINPSTKHSIGIKVEEAKVLPTTPRSETSKITVTLPRFSPITPETPTNALAMDRVKKCIPFPCLGRANDLSVNSFASGDVNSFVYGLKEFDRKTDPERPRSDPPPFSNCATKSSPAAALPLDGRPAITLPAPLPASCPRVTKCSKETPPPHGRELFVSRTPHSSPPPPLLSHGNRSVSLWDHSSALTVSLPKQILDNSNRSADESTFSLHATPGPCSATSNDFAEHVHGKENEEEEEEDSPELLHLMEKFKMQYKTVTKTMKTPCFKNKLLKDIDFEKSRQESLLHRISVLKSELSWLHEENGILNYHCFMRRHHENSNYPKIPEEFPSVISSPGLLDRAVCLDSTIMSNDRSVSLVSKIGTNLQPQDDAGAMAGERPTSCPLTADSDEDCESIHPPSPEMPLLMPETCANFITDERPIQHSKFAPPPRLTVCNNESKGPLPPPQAHASNSNYSNNNHTSHPNANSIVKTSLPGHQICFSPISSCGTESPVGSPRPSSSALIEGHENRHSSFKNNPSTDPYYSLLSGSLQGRDLQCHPDVMLSKCSAARFTCENTEPYFDVKKRKALDEAVPDHLSKIKRLHLSGYLLSQAGSDGSSSFDNMILRNVLNSRGLSATSSCIESRSDSRDSGFGKDSETDSETLLNRPRPPPRNLSMPEIQCQRQYFPLPEYDLPHLNGSSETADVYPDGDHRENPRRENRCQVMAHGEVRGLDQQTCRSIQPFNYNHAYSCFSYDDGHPPRPELSFSSLANYYEKCLSQEGGTAIHDNHINDNGNNGANIGNNHNTNNNNQISNHFNLLRHNFSSVLT